MRLFLAIALAAIACSQAQRFVPNDGPINIPPCWETPDDASCAPIACTEAQSDNCDELALCDLSVVPDIGCHCPEGLIGGGCTEASGYECGSPKGCSSEGWAAKVTFDVTGLTIDSNLITADYNGKIVGINLAHKRAWATRLFGQDIDDFFRISSMHHQLSDITVWEGSAPVNKRQLTLNMLFPVNGRALADAAAAVFNSRKANYTELIKPYVFGAELVFGARVYRWKEQTTSAPQSIQATGMNVDFVQFDPACMDSGCWVIDVTYTAGAATGNFNTFYLPRVDTSSPWQEDEADDTDWTGTDVWDTFFPKYFPCGSNVDKTKWKYSDKTNMNNPQQTGYTSTCCIPNFVANYRTIEGFEGYFASQGDGAACTDGAADIVDRPNFVEETAYDIGFPAARPFLSGPFSDILANAEYISVLDPFIGQHTARIRIDEVELRRKAGLLTGTVGVEYTVDTFIGFANFRPTGTVVLDSAAMQVNLHLEKTNFFSVSTEGENAYTFLEYVNMRLVTVYKEDVVFGGESEDNTDPTKAFDTNFYQTSDEGSADYVQVTFTMGDQYSPNLLGMPWDGGLIPLNSVRAGQGAFFDDDFMEHKCVDYFAHPGSFWLPPAQRGGGGNPPPGPDRRRSEESGEESKPARKLLQSESDPTVKAIRRNETWGPLNSCSEQSRCVHLEYTQLAGSQCNPDGECEWEVCMVFDASVDPGCKVFQECKTEYYCHDFSKPGLPCDADGGACCDPADASRCEDTGSLGGVLYSSSGVAMGYCRPVSSKCAFTSDGEQGAGDVYDEFFRGNLYMWCSETTSDCPADTNYPLGDVEYFQPVENLNISQHSRNCQRGKPGQKLFFVMRDGDECKKVNQGGDTTGVFTLPEATKALWTAQGHQWPTGAQAFCEPRNTNNDQCDYCLGDDAGENADPTFRLNEDGTNPCGCTRLAGGLVSGFDTCTYDATTGSPFSPFTESTYRSTDTGNDVTIQNVEAECVWTVVLPEGCSGCSCGYDKATGNCIDCNPNNNCPSGPVTPPIPGSQYPAGFDCCGDFNGRLCQDCAPGANMCVSPVATPDNFVSFNIPLGVDWYPEPSSDLSQNVFVHMVINALSSEGCDNPNEGCDPLQVKTTLFGSIPVVEGGINIFCDGVRAKTDLVDVANADIVVGTAASMSELSRLRILKDIASTSLSKFEGETTIDSDSIEAGFLTLILKGNSSFFELRNTKRFGLELEDLITIHIMEPDSTMFTEVNDLLGAPPTDNYDTTTNNLIDAGYELNGAFRFTINRIENRASLEPTAALLAKCPFNPPRPSYDVPFPTTCVTRRDVRHRGFPNRAGALSTAMEVVPLLDVAAGTCVSKDPDDLVTGVYPPRSDADDWGFCGTGCTMNQNAKFMQNVLGASDYADGLGRDYSCVIAQKYKLDSRYNRAWWINPSYEWTPTQTGGQPIFTVSQKIFLFALVNLNEQFGAPSVANSGIPAPQGPKLSRRRLLSNTQNTGSGMSASVMEFDVTPSKMLADSFSVPVDKVATWKITFALTADQACMEPAELQKAIRGVLGGYSLDHVSNYEALLITSMTVDKDGIQCPARRSSRRLLNNPTATVEMMIVFAAGANANIDVDSFKSSPGIMTMEAVEVSPKVGTTAGDWTRATPEPEESSGSNIGLIAGCAAGGAVLLLGGGFLLWRMNKPSAEAEVASALPDLAALKSQLQSEAA